MERTSVGRSFPDRTGVRALTLESIPMELLSMSDALRSPDGAAERGSGECVTADTWVLSARGARRVHELVGVPFVAVVDGRGYPSTSAGFFFAGVKAAFDVRTIEGPGLKASAEHNILCVGRDGRKSWKRVADVKSGERLALHEHDHASWDGPGTFEHGRTVGSFFGTRNHLRVYALIRHAQAIIGDRGARQSPDAVELAARYGMDAATRHISHTIESASSDFTRGFLLSTFDAFGRVATSADAPCVRLATPSLGDLQAAQRMLARLGVSSILENFSERGVTDGELLVAGDALVSFATRIGFGDADKMRSLKASLTSAVQSDDAARGDRVPRTAAVASITPIGRVPLFDCQIPGINAFDANGVYVHNCGLLAADFPTFH